MLQIFHLQKEFKSLIYAIPAFNLYLVLDEFAVKCLTFDHRLWFLGKPWMQFETLITFEPSRAFSQHETSEIQETSAKVHSSVRNDKTSYLWFFLSFENFFLFYIFYLCDSFLIFIQRDEKSFHCKCVTNSIWTWILTPGFG